MYLKNTGIPPSAVDRAFEIVTLFDTESDCSPVSSSIKHPWKSKMLSPEILVIPTSDTLATITRRGIIMTFFFNDRLDVANQKRGDFKETFNMGKFADPEYKQNLPPILMSHWPEIQDFQNKCHSVTLKVLTLFALALNVTFFWESS